MDREIEINIDRVRQIELERDGGRLIQSGIQQYIAGVIVGLRTQCVRIAYAIERWHFIGLDRFGQREMDRDIKILIDIWI